MIRALILAAALALASCSSPAPANTAASTADPVGCPKPNPQHPNVRC